MVSEHNKAMQPPCDIVRMMQVYRYESGQLIQTDWPQLLVK